MSDMTIEQLAKEVLEKRQRFMDGHAIHADALADAIRMAAAATVLARAVLEMQAENARLREELKALEWFEGKSEYYCLRCGATRKNGHHADCSLQLALELHP
jgi:histidinol-phosphate/aromatic aminotransferase/cobyric acid decarboxylase-like protein